MVCGFYYIINIKVETVASLHGGATMPHSILRQLPMKMYSTRAIARKERGAKYEIITIERGWTGEDDINIDIKFCGFSPFADVHLANYDWGSVAGVCAVVGHEISGVVAKVGSNVKDLDVGDHVGVGYYIDSCLDCDYCNDGQENNCIQGITRTSCGVLKHGRVRNDNGKYS